MTTQSFQKVSWKRSDDLFTGWQELVPGNNRKGGIVFVEVKIDVDENLLRAYFPRCERGYLLNEEDWYAFIVITAILCQGTFDSVFRGFLSPLLESLASQMLSLTPATLLAFLS